VALAQQLSQGFHITCRSVVVCKRCDPWFQAYGLVQILSVRSLSHYHAGVFAIHASGRLAGQQYSMHRFPYSRRTGQDGGVRWVESLVQRADSRCTRSLQRLRHSTALRGSQHR
jgi:hypothetical protein